MAIQWWACAKRAVRQVIVAKAHFPTALFLALIFLPLSFTGADAQTANADNTSQVGASQRLTRLSNFLAEQAKLGDDLTNQLATAPSSRTSTILRQSQLEGGAVAKMVISSGNGISASGATNATNKTLVINSARDKSQTLSHYSQYLRHLSDQVKSAPAAEVIPILRAAFVPRDVQIVIDPAQPPGLNGQPSLQSFSTLNAPSAGSEPIELNDGLIAFIVGGGTTIDYPSVAAILYSSGAAVSIRCTGTLISPTVVISAAHCDEESDPVEVYFQHAGRYSVDHVLLHERFAFPYADLMLIFLKTPVIGISPLAINDTARLPTIANGEIIGFGYHNDDLQLASNSSDQVVANVVTVQLVKNAGIKLHAQVVTNSCPSELAGKSLICWTYQRAVATNLYGSTCYGDSGGPLIANTSNGLRLVGITTGGTTCLPGDRAADVEVYDFADWIASAIKSTRPNDVAQLTPTLDGLTNSPNRYSFKLAYFLFDTNHTAFARTFAISTGIKVLRFSVNATPAASPLRLVAGPIGEEPACNGQDTGPVIYCEVRSPKAGEWAINVEGSPSQEVQAVATIF